MSTVGGTLEQAVHQFQAGRLADAETLCRKVLRTGPQHLAFRLLGIIAFRMQQVDAAVEFLRQALAADPLAAECYLDLSLVLLSQGHATEAETAASCAVTLQPRLPEAAYHLGNALLRQGRLEAAAVAFQHALHQRPRYAEAEVNLGIALDALGRPTEAVEAYARAIAIQPDLVEAWNNLASVLNATSRFHDAAHAARQALRLRPQFAAAENNLGNALQALGESAAAVEAYHRCLTVEPTHPQATYNQGIALESQVRLTEATAAYRRALTLQPAFAEAENNLGLVLQAQGLLDDACAAFTRGLALQPHNHVIHSNLLQLQQYRPGVSPATLNRAHADWSLRQTADVVPSVQFPHDRHPGRRLRIGFVSPDLGEHPVGRFLAPVLESFDRTQFETVCYSDRARPDAVTDRLATLVDGWRSIGGQSRATVTQQIRNDRIDILIDLAGHTAGNRLMVFADKPAPVQMTWIGYVGTTGLNAIDYLLADRFQVPAGDEANYREQVLRLPHGYLCFEPPADAPEPGPLPAATRGSVTFGSMNNPSKITPEVIAAWSGILRRVADSRLLLQYRGWEDAGTRQRFLDAFAQEGIESRRITLRQGGPRSAMLAAYQQLDIALDTFPYSGGLTTCEALWMGVPVITFPGPTFAGRHAFSHLSNAGLTETIAGNVGEYADLAVGLAQDLPRLSALRAGLRAQVAASPLCDREQFAADLGAAFRGAWRRFCAAN